MQIRRVGGVVKAVVILVLKVCDARQYNLEADRGGGDSARVCGGPGQDAAWLVVGECQMIAICVI